MRMGSLRDMVSRHLSDRGSQTQESPQGYPSPLSEFDEIRRQLLAQGLFDDETLVLIARDGERVVFDAQGHPVRAGFFDCVAAPFALFTPGTHARRQSEQEAAVKASTDDMAQLFGYELPCVDVPHRDMPAALIRNRGLLVTGRFPKEPVAAVILGEKLCRVELLAPAIGQAHHLNPMLCAAEHAVYLAAYSRRQLRDTSDAEDETSSAPDIPPLSHEDVLRNEVVAYGRKLVDERLIQATWGNVSVRVDDDHFLISPSGVDYFSVTSEEVALVSVADGGYEKGLHPSSERRMHQLIYQERPDINAIVHTHSANCAVFAACHEDLLTDELDYPCAPYAVSGSKRLATNVSRVMVGHDGCILANHGFVTGADTLERAFAQAQEAEEAAGRRLEA